MVDFVEEAVQSIVLPLDTDHDVVDRHVGRQTDGILNV